MATLYKQLTPKLGYRATALGTVGMRRRSRAGRELSEEERGEMRGRGRARV